MGEEYFSFEARRARHLVTAHATCFSASKMDSLTFATLRLASNVLSFRSIHGRLVVGRTCTGKTRPSKLDSPSAYSISRRTFSERMESGDNRITIALDFLSA